MKTIESLKVGDVIAFEDPTDGIVVEKISQIDNGRFFVCYIYGGYKSTSQDLTLNEILAIGDPRGESGKLGNWTGRYKILQPEKIKAILKK